MALRVDHLSFSAESKDGVCKEVLQDIQCVFSEGQITLLVGPPGAGKSTLLDVIGGLREPGKGNVEIANRPLWVRGGVHPDVQNTLGMSFQAPEQQLFARTIRKEFAYSLRPYRLSRNDLATRSEASLSQLGLPAQLLQVSPFILSQGQKRRVALATTMATEPDWLLLDEPTAGLDPRGVADFVRLLQAQLPKLAGGIVVATHDLDSFLPVAARVIFLKNGRILADVPTASLLNNQSLWQSAGIGMPSSIELGSQLLREGINIDLEGYSPQEAASAISRRLRDGSLSEDTTQSSQTQHTLGESVEWSNVRNMAAEEGSREQAVAHRGLADIVHRLDPRCKFITYMLLTVGILFQAHWLGLVGVTLLTVIIVGISKLPMRDIVRLGMPLGTLVIVGSIVSGLHFSSGAAFWHLWIARFGWASATATFKHMYPFVLVMLLGIVVSATTSHLRMKQGIEQGLAPLKKLRLPVEALALAASLALRFIPVILTELQRFTRIVRSRSKSHRRHKGIPWRQLPAIVLPLLLSVLRIGDDLATALEGRGFHSVTQERTRAEQLRFSRIEWQVLAGAVSMLALLLVCNQIA